MDNVTEQECKTLGGKFYGPLSTCAVEGSACISVVGACCLNWSGSGKECYENYTEEWCYTKGGKFIGEGTTCNDALWCTTYYGSCCFGEGCEDAWEHDDCEIIGGIFWIDSCAELQDVEMCVATVGACCFNWQLYCEDNIIQDDCISMGGYFYGDETICNDVTDCPYLCSSDINEDGQTNVHDLLAVIDQWGLFETPADVNSDGIVDVSDLLILVGNWGPCE